MKPQEEMAYLMIFPVKQRGLLPKLTEKLKKDLLQGPLSFLNGLPMSQSELLLADPSICSAVIDRRFFSAHVRILRTLLQSRGL